MSCIHKVRTKSECLTYAPIRIDTEAESKTQEPQSVQGFSESWPTRGAIEFQDYSVKYRPNLPEVLQNVNVFIRQGEKVSFSFDKCF